jgi:hypothetical protein
MVNASTSMSMNAFSRVLGLIAISFYSHAITPPTDKSFAISPINAAFFS